LGTELATKYTIQAFVSLAVPVPKYSVGIINWGQGEQQKLDKKTRKLLTIHGEHHTKADVDRLLVPTKQRGRELKQTTEAYVVGITKLVEYVESKKDSLMRIVRKHPHTISSTKLPRAKRLKIELQTEKRQIKERIAENRKGML
jgi:hypothetical protein